jgi:hypothetical protein
MGGVAQQKMVHGQARPAHPRDPCTDVNRVGIRDRIAVVAGDRCQDHADLRRLPQYAQPDPIAVENKSRLEPTEINCAVDVLERVLIAPENRRRQHDRVSVKHRLEIRIEIHDGVSVSSCETGIAYTDSRKRR